MVYLAENECLKTYRHSGITAHIHKRGCKHTHKLWFLIHVHAWRGLSVVKTRRGGGGGVTAQDHAFMVILTLYTSAPLSPCEKRIINFHDADDGDDGIKGKDQATTSMESL